CEDGLSRLISIFGGALQARCDVHLETIAKAIRWGPYGVEVDVEASHGKATLRARTAVITVPLTLLDALAIEPDLPDRRIAASRVRMGHVAKVALQFRNPFWEEKNELRKLMFLFMPGETFPTLWAGAANTPVLNAWAGGPRARHLCSMDDGDVIARAIDGVA